MGAMLPSAVESLQIVSTPGIIIPQSDVPLIVNWLKELKKRLVCEYIAFNGVLISVSELNKEQIDDK